MLINNAGVGTVVPASKETPEGFREVIEVNLNGAFWMSQACQPLMPEGASIVNVASVLAHVAPRFPQAAYTASKAGLLGLTRDLAQEWSGRKGIRVNALCPGYFDSEMTRDQEPLRDVVAAETMLGRFGRQHELDAALIFLASPASSYITGTSLLVDGGMSRPVNELGGFRAGEGPPLLLLHGLAMSWRAWRPLLASAAAPTTRCSRRRCPGIAAAPSPLPT